MLSSWSKDDITQQKALDDLLTRKITWNLTTAEVVQAYRTLVWMAGLKEKIEASLIEDVKITKLDTPPEAVEEKSQKPTKIRTRKSQDTQAPKGSA